MKKFLGSGGKAGTQAEYQLHGLGARGTSGAVGKSLAHAVDCFEGVDVLQVSLGWGVGHYAEVSVMVR